MSERTVPFDLLDELDQAVNSYRRRLDVLVHLGLASHFGPNNVQEVLAEGLQELGGDFDRVEAARAALWEHWKERR